MLGSSPQSDERTRCAAGQLFRCESVARSPSWNHQRRWPASFRPLAGCGKDRRAWPQSSQRTTDARGVSEASPKNGTREPASRAARWAAHRLTPVSSPRGESARNRTSPQRPARKPEPHRQGQLPPRNGRPGKMSNADAWHKSEHDRRTQTVERRVMKETPRQRTNYLTG